MQIPTPKKEQEADSDTGYFLFLTDFGKARAFRLKRARSCSKQELLLFTHFYTQPHSWFPKLRFVSPFVLPQNGKALDMLQLNEGIEKKLSVIRAFRSRSLFFICQRLQPERSLRTLFSCFSLKESSINLLRKILGCVDMPACSCLTAK